MVNFILFILLIPAMILRGWVLLNMWTWFILPLGAPEINLAHALGLSTTLYLMNGMEVSTEENSDEEKIKKFAQGVIILLITLFIGWIIQMFM